MISKETNIKLKDEKYYSKFITNRLKEAKNELKEQELFIKNTLVEFEVILMLADDMANQLHKIDDKSGVKSRYDLMKQKLNIN
jgi:hypothetical protein